MKNIEKTPCFDKTKCK